MFIRLKKNLLATLMVTLLAGSQLPAHADISDNLPDIGTTAGGTLSINQELAMGDFYVRQLRASAPIRIHDCANVATSFPNFLALCAEVGIRVAEEGKS